MMNLPINYNDEEERRKTHPLLLRNIEAGTKGEELKKNPNEDSIKSNKTALDKTQDVYGNGVHKAAEKLLSQQVKKPSLQRRSVLDGHVPRGLEDRTGDYSTYPVGSKYPALVEYLKRYPDCAKCAQLGRHLLARVRSRVKHQIS